MGGGQAKQPPVARRRPDPVQRRARRIRECGGTELHAFGPSRRARCGDHHSGFFINGTAAGPGGDPLGGLHGFGGERVKETGQPPGGQVSLQRQDGRAGTVQGRREALQQPPARFLRGQHNRVQRTIYHARKVRSCENGPGLTVTADPAVTNVSRILTVEGARVVGLETLLGSLRAFAIPMTTKFRGITVREGALIEGPAGWGEFSPFAEYGPRESARWLASALEAAGTGWPAAVRDRVPVNVTVPAVGPARAYEIAASSGCRTAKVKVAERDQTDADDIARVEAVRDALGPDGKVRIDVNGRWDVAHATRMLAALAPFGLEYAEQPCMTLDEMAELRRATDVPLAADESIRKAEDPMRVRAAGAADVVVLKVQPLAGVRAALRIAEACGLPVVVSSAVDTSIGLAAGLALAGALPDLPYACGLGTMSLLAGDVTAAPLDPVAGELPVRRPAVDPGELSRWEVDPAAWRGRAMAAAEFLGETGVLASLGEAR